MIMWLATTGLFLSGINGVEAADGDIRVSGFLTTIFTQAKIQDDIDTNYDYGLAEKDVELDTRDSHLGLQFGSTINPQTKVTAQIISRGGGTNSYNLETDWAYVDYQALESFRVRVGKYKIPQFIASDYLDVGYAYPWVRPPQDVYSTNPLISLNGLDLLYKINFGESKLFFDLFYGDGTHNTFVPPRTFDFMDAGDGTQDGVVHDPGTGDVVPLSKGQHLTFDTANTRGVGVKYAAPHYTVRAGYFKTEVTQADFGMDHIPGAFGGVGFTMDYNDIVAYAEFILRNTDPRMASAFPDQDAWYTTIGYRFGKLLPSFTVSQIKKGIDSDPNFPVAIEESSRAFNLRYDLDHSTDVKLEILNVTPKDGNHGLFGVPVEKGTIYTLAFDVIF